MFSVAPMIEWFDRAVVDKRRESDAREPGPGGIVFGASVDSPIVAWKQYSLTSYPAHDWTSVP